VDQLAESSQVLPMDTKVFSVNGDGLMEGKPDGLMEDAMIAANGSRLHDLVNSNAETNVISSGLQVRVLNPFAARLKTAELCGGAEI